MRLFTFYNPPGSCLINILCYLPKRAVAVALLLNLKHRGLFKSSIELPAMLIPNLTIVGSEKIQVIYFYSRIMAEKKFIEIPLNRLGFSFFVVFEFFPFLSCHEWLASQSLEKRSLRKFTHDSLHPSIHPSSYLYLYLIPPPCMCAMPVSQLSRGKHTHSI